MTVKSGTYGPSVGLAKLNYRAPPDSPASRLFPRFARRRELILPFSESANVCLSAGRQAAVGCGFNQSTQRIDEIAQLVFRSLVSSSGVR